MGKTRNYSLYIGVFFVSLMLIGGIIGPKVAPHDLTYNSGVYSEVIDGKYTLFSPPFPPFESKQYILGTDYWGYDLLSELLYGMRYTIIIGVSVALIKVLLGTIIGIGIGMLKKQPVWWEAFEETWSYIPSFLIVYFMLVNITIESPFTPVELSVLFALIAGIVGVPSIASTVRHKTIEIKKRPFMEAAVVSGATRMTIIRKEVFPHLRSEMPYLLVIEIVHTLSLMGQLALFNLFIGGTKFDPEFNTFVSVTKEWAGLVGQARPSLMWGQSYLMFIPLAFLLFMILSFTLLAHGIKVKAQKTYFKAPWY
ncbi:ABC transporter permease subunit [Priestia koreensis]|uniref:ABC transporter permease subunit n=1 Tax=Priestia koreensis TaxID=284581 RepID=UPI001F591B35|nr:ABC transporter permease subunit [Priestia koreensis]UNL83017.1 ABC transporter permease subunit [Priestia koreensis]